ncbi:MAG TPA: ABC transporter permease [Bryobacteraceae bacterium]|nr:ABC transporter permease [Bryobacteraceae bacterium]
MLQDFRFALRMIRRAPGFAALTILCLTLGIGANTAVFSWIEGILLRPFPAVANQDRLMVLGGMARGASRATAVSWPDFLDYQKSCSLFDSFIADRLVATTLSIGDRAERAPGSVVSANYFDALGVHPILGRGFLPAEDFGRNAHPVTVISHQLWRERYGSDPNVIGHSQMLNGLPHTIVGVAPEGFLGTFVGYSIQYWVPVSMQERFEPGGYKLDDRGARWIEGFARLKPGVTRAQAQAEISAVARRLEGDYPATNRGRGVGLLALWQSPFNSAAVLLPILSVTLAVAGLVLLIACANVGNLLLVRSFARRQEMMIRLAIGAGRGRLLRLLLTEGLMMAALAAAGGLIAAQWCRNLLVLFFPPQGVALNLAAQIDLRVLGFSAVVCALTTLLFGLVPALQTSKLDLAAGLKADAGAMVGGERRRSLLRAGLVLVQVSLSFVLLVGAGLLFQSLREMQRASPGFSTQGVLNASIDLFAAGYDAARGKAFEDELIGRVQGLPGVESAVFARVTPFSYRGYSSGPIVVEGYQPAPDEQPSVEYNEVGPAYFSTLGIPLVSGREFTRGDNENAPLVTVVNQTFAAHYWPGQDPVGKRLQLKGRWLQVAGVARDSKYRTFLESPKAFLYVPLRQAYSGQVMLHIRTRQAPETIAASLAREVHALDPNLALSAVLTMKEQVLSSTSGQRIAVTLLGVFGGLALLLATVGLYGMMSYAVSQRTRELGLRMALGAAASDVLRLVLAQGMIPTLGGIVLGAAASLGLTRLVTGLLYHVNPRDVPSFASAFLIMLLASLGACLVPAWRAARTDPVRALRDSA